VCGVDEHLSLVWRAEGGGGGGVRSTSPSRSFGERRVVVCAIDEAPSRSFGERRGCVVDEPLALGWRVEGSGEGCVRSMNPLRARLESGGWWWGVYGLDEAPPRLVWRVEGGGGVYVWSMSPLALIKRAEGDGGGYVRSTKPPHTCLESGGCGGDGGVCAGRRKPFVRI